MARFALYEDEKNLIRKRDFGGLIQAGLNIYWMLKLGSVTGNSLYRMGAQMRGETYEQFLSTRNFKDAPLMAQDRRRDRAFARSVRGRRRRPRQDADAGVEAAGGRLCAGAGLAEKIEARCGDRRLQRPRRRFPLGKYPTFAIGAADEYAIADEGFGTRPLPPVPGDAEFSIHLCEAWSKKNSI